MATSASNTQTIETHHQEMPDTTETMDELKRNYQIRPNLNESFRSANIKDIIVDVLQQVLEGKEYNSREAANWSRQIVDDISKRIKDLSIPRYKHIVQAMLAEQTGAGCRFIARCCWDAECDSKVSESYTSENIVCIVTVFGIYLY